MLEEVHISITSLKYSGKSIGNDIRIEWETPGKAEGFNKKIKNGSTEKINEEIGSFYADQESFTLPATLKVIERDLIFNDTGSKDIKIKVSEAIRYIKEQEDGWLKVKIDNKVKSLPAFLKVRFERSNKKREYFTILEGAYQGKTASVKLDDGNKSFLITGNYHTGSIKMKYSISKKILTVNNNIYIIKDYPNFPWKKGFCDVEIPDAPHTGGTRYISDSKKAKVWFRVGHNGDRYIHTGSASLGCITLTEYKKWDDLYSLLIKSRKGDSQSIGILEVVD